MSFDRDNPWLQDASPVGPVSLDDSPSESPTENCDARIFDGHWNDIRTPFRAPLNSRMGKVSETDRVFEQIKEWLITTVLPPGDFLSEPDLAERCQTSRTPVREALSRLAQDRWIVNIRRKGYLVTPISVRDIVELYELRGALESYTAGKVAQSISAAQVAELREILKPEAEACDDLTPILRANEKFHLKLAEFSGNQRILSQLTLSLGYVRRLDTLCTQTVPGWIGHEIILEAIASHRAAEASRTMAEHIQASRDKMIHLFGK